MLSKRGNTSLKRYVGVENFCVCVRVVHVGLSRRLEAEKPGEAYGLERK